MGRRISVELPEPDRSMRAAHWGDHLYEVVHQPGLDLPVRLTTRLSGAKIDLGWTAEDALQRALALFAAALDAGAELPGVDPTVRCGEGPHGQPCDEPVAEDARPDPIGGA
ncbi:MAG TPA: hypothetical protein VGD67_21765 [Pseudonocardiaceae bacterium]